MEFPYILCYNTDSINCANAICTIRKRGIILNNELIRNEKILLSISNSFNSVERIELVTLS